MKAGSRRLVLAMAFTAAGPTGCQEPVGRLAPHAWPVARPARSDVPRDQQRYVGVVTSPERSDVAPVDAGVLEAVLVEVGDRVKAGQVLARLRADVSEAEISRARAELRVAQTRRRRLAGTVEDANAVAVEEESLFARGHGTRRDRDETRRKERRERARLAEADAEARAARARIGVVEEAAKARLVLAPFDGIVTARHLDPGATASAGRPVVHVVRSSGTRIRFAVPTVDVASLEVGADVRVESERDGYDARVEAIAPDVDVASQMVFVNARLVSETDALRPGMAVEIRL